MVDTMENDIVDKTETTSNTSPQDDVKSEKQPNDEAEAKQQAKESKDDVHNDVNDDGENDDENDAEELTTDVKDSVTQQVLDGIGQPTIDEVKSSVHSSEVATDNVLNDVDRQASSTATTTKSNDETELEPYDSSQQALNAAVNILEKPLAINEKAADENVSTAATGDNGDDKIKEQQHAVKSSADFGPTHISRAALRKLRQRHYTVPTLLVTPIDWQAPSVETAPKSGMRHQSVQTNISSAPTLKLNAETGSVVEDPETSEIVNVMKRYQRLLRRVFDHYARRDSSDDIGEKLLSSNEFEIMCREFALLPSLTEVDALHHVFKASTRRGAPQLLSFRDFVECLTRLALTVYTPSERFHTSEQKLSALFRAMHLDCKDIVLHRLQKSMTQANTNECATPITAPLVQEDLDEEIQTILEAFDNERKASTTRRKPELTSQRFGPMSKQVKNTMHLVREHTDEMKARDEQPLNSESIRQRSHVRMATNGLATKRYEQNLEHIPMQAPLAVRMPHVTMPNSVHYPAYTGEVFTGDTAKPMAYNVPQQWLRYEQQEMPPENSGYAARYERQRQQSNSAFDLNANISYQDDNEHDTKLTQPSVCVKKTRSERNKRGGAAKHHPGERLTPSKYTKSNIKGKETTKTEGTDAKLSKAERVKERARQVSDKEKEQEVARGRNHIKGISQRHVHQMKRGMANIPRQNKAATANKYTNYKSSSAYSTQPYKEQYVK